ncbi:MAG: enoyl-CoA hydratase/isomerase family protein, partial [Deltaproteobacteria bacterium]|nr:enoyl-CoA hydratase/isomerase family protein [Deltaproteobacteria bacterium]
MKALSVHVENHIAYLKFDLPGEKVNKLTLDLMDDFRNHLKSLESHKDVKAVIFYSGKKDIFIAGVDISFFQTIKTQEQGEKLSRDAQAFADEVECFSKPIVSAIHGACLGGGLELALACDYRIATDSPKTVLGLPEVKLGFIPGMGGCVRLPKLIGLQQSLGIILPGGTVSGKKAGYIGLADDVVPYEFLLEKAAQFIKNKNFKKAQKGFKGKKNLFYYLLEKNPLGKALVFHLATKNVLSQTKGHYPAPLAAIQVVKKTVSVSQKLALLFEAQTFGKLCITPISSNLVKLFFLSEEMKKDKGVRSDSVPRVIKSVGVLGAGAMGGGIAQLAAYKDLEVYLKDINEGAIVRGLSQARSVFTKALQRKKIQRHEFENKWAKISPTLTYAGFRSLDIVIEAVIEDLNLKKKVFAELETKVKESTILATNTSSISVDDMARDLKHPERFVGMHFFNPVHKMPLVEVIRGEKTTDEVVATTVQFAKVLGKLPLVVKNRPGFLVNRILMPYMNEAAYLVEEGAQVEEVDQAALSFGMPMGPFTLLDEVGLDVVIKASNTVVEAFKERFQRCELLEVVYAAERYGKKTQEGFYNYNKKGKRSGVYERIEDFRKDKKTFSKEH